MKRLHELRIVVASPNDVKEERKILEEVATELNRGVAKDHELYIEISGWDIDAYPGFHVAGAQGLIDLVLQIEDCELFIGIFWKRFGTPTFDAKSGTEHEFRKAYEAWKRNQRPQIMIYFNEEESSPKTKEELVQRGLILDFKDEFPKEGLWWSYNGIQDFAKCVRQHLTQFIRKISDLPQNSFYINTSTAIKASTSRSLPIEEQVSLWLGVKGSNKERTREQYERAINHYRDLLRKYNFDLNSEDEKIISTLVEQWAKSGIGKEVADYTYNQRISIIKSFYQFACEHDWMSKNPIEKVKRRKEKRREPNYSDNILNPDTIMETIKSGLKKVDRNTPLGKRDYALLSLMFTTRRRVSEVKDLKCGDISVKGNCVTVTWRGTRDSKGKPLQLPLSPDISNALLDYLEVAYGNNRPNDTPLWLSYSRYYGGRKGEAIGNSAIRAVCVKYLEISNLEIIRQTLIALEKIEGAKGIEKSLEIN